MLPHAIVVRMAPTSASFFMACEASLALEMAGNRLGLFSATRVVRKSPAAPAMMKVQTLPLSIDCWGSGLAIAVASVGVTVCGSNPGCEPLSGVRGRPQPFTSKAWALLNGLSTMAVPAIANAAFLREKMLMPCMQTVISCRAAPQCCRCRCYLVGCSSDRCSPLRRLGG